MVPESKPPSRVLDQARELIIYGGWAQGGTDPGLCLTSALNLANHGHLAYTEDLPDSWQLEPRLRRRATLVLRVLIDQLEPGRDHEHLPARRIRRWVEDWNDQFARQECEALAALRRAARDAARREEIGLLRL